MMWFRDSIRFRKGLACIMLGVWLYLSILCWYLLGEWKFDKAPAYFGTMAVFVGMLYLLVGLVHYIIFGGADTVRMLRLDGISVRRERVAGRDEPLEFKWEEPPEFRNVFPRVMWGIWLVWMWAFIFAIYKSGEGAIIILPLCMGIVSFVLFLVYHLIYGLYGIAVLSGVWNGDVSGRESWLRNVGAVLVSAPLLVLVLVTCWQFVVMVPVGVFHLLFL